MQVGRTFRCVKAAAFADNIARRSTKNGDIFFDLRWLRTNLCDASHQGIEPTPLGIGL
jgi:hypothetical protein